VRIDEWLNEARTRLADAGIESQALEAQLLAAHPLGWDRSRLLAHLEEEISADSNELLARRLTGEPLAYILGYREFYGRQFEVSPAVLIPRQETETLIDAFGSIAAPERAKVLDMGTGSGCIGITLKLGHPNLAVTLADISHDALSVAKRNTQALGAEVEAIETDAFQNLENKDFDVIITNPPYVRLTDKLGPGVQEFEPNLALFAGADGLDFYRLLANDAPNHLKTGGVLLTEVGDDQSQAVQNVFAEAGWIPAGVWPDLLQIERVLAFKPPPCHNDRHGNRRP
jgi:release factor glutamine methyltransferase